MYSKAIQILVDEHQVILNKNQQFREILELPDISALGRQIEEFIRFYKEYADAFHHKKEEQMLFPLVAQKNEMLKTTIIQSLEDHHEDFRTSLSDAIDALNDGNWDEVKTILLDYLSDIEDHISAEDDEFFLTADEFLSEDEKENLFFRFLDVDRELGETKKIHLELL
jgi:hemerythrin-like domain-containing protein